MTLFALLVALLLALVLAAVLLPLLRRGAAPAAADESRANLVLLREQLAELDAERDAGTLGAETYAAARAELERRVLEETAGAPNAPAPPRQRAPGSAIALGLLVPVVAVALYLRLGNPQALEAPAPLAGDPPVSAADVDALLTRLAQRMEAEPGDPQGWAILARSYAALQRWPESLRAFERAVALLPNDAALLADYADVMGANQGQRLAGEPTRLIERALHADPDHLKALALAGSAALERGDAAAAIVHWSRARALVPAGGEFAAGLDASLADARAAAAGNVGAATGTVAAAGPAAAPPAAPGTAASAAAAVRGRVQLSPALAGQVRPGDTVFVFARAAEGPRMPLAIQRRTVADLPFDFTLDDSMAMSPALRLSNFGRVVVGARVSRSGDAMPQPGDLVGSSAAVAPGGAVQIIIDQRQP